MNIIPFELCCGASIAYDFPRSFSTELLSALTQNNGALPESASKTTRVRSESPEYTHYAANINAWRTEFNTKSRYTRPKRTTLARIEELRQLIDSPPNRYIYTEKNTETDNPLKVEYNRQRKVVKDNLENIKKDNGGKDMLVVILNCKQKLVYGDLFLEAGFKEVFHTCNTNHGGWESGHTIHLYARERYECPSKKKSTTKSLFQSNPA